MTKHADLMLKTQPRWIKKGCDMYYWYHGTKAMALYGRKAWKPWSAAIRGMGPHQKRTGCSKGSWDPVGPWGMKGGRVYSTALMVSSLAMVERGTE
jgi:hypothetical protein